MRKFAFTIICVSAPALVLVDISGSYAGDVVLVNFWAAWCIPEFYRKNKMNYPVVAENENIAEAYGGILRLPTSVLISRDGSIHAKHPGLADFSTLEKDHRSPAVNQ